MSYKVNLEIFEGPMDLLLYLIKKNDLNIYDIPISKITTEYLSYLDMMKELNLDIAGQFLVMAATLIQVKSAMLLPLPEEEEQEGDDPRAELVSRLLEYQKYKEAAKFLTAKADENKGVFYRGMPVFSKDEYVLDANLFDIMGSFRALLNKAKDDVKEILYDDIPIEQKIREILTVLEEKDWVTFEELFAGETRRLGLIVGFLAILELIRLRQIVAHQNKAFGNIQIRLLKEQPAEDLVPEEKGAAEAEAPVPVDHTEQPAEQDNIEAVPEMNEAVKPKEENIQEQPKTENKEVEVPAPVEDTEQPIEQENVEAAPEVQETVESAEENIIEEPALSESKNMEAGVVPEAKQPADNNPGK